MDVPTHNIALTFGREASQTFVDFAQVNFRGFHNGYCIETSQSTPHITIAQIIAADNEALMRIQERLTKVTPQTIPVDLTALSFKVEGPMTWIELIAANSPELFQLHQDVCDIMRRLDMSIHNAHGEEYRPHLTLARVASDQTIGVLIPKNVPIMAEVPAHLSLGISDDNYQFTKKVPRL